MKFKNSPIFFILEFRLVFVFFPLMEKEKFLLLFSPKKKNILNASLIVYTREKDKPKIHEKDN